jgi:hypothetical protein
MNFSPVINVFLQLHVDCVRYHSGDYRTERLVHSITVVLRVVQIHINTSIKVVAGEMCQTSGRRFGLYRYTLP